MEFEFVRHEPLYDRIMLVLTLDRQKMKERMEEQSDGDFEVAYTFESDDMPELIESNAYTTYGCIPYEGTPGTRYYATFGLYAKNSSGNETIYFDTNIITA